MKTSEKWRATFICPQEITNVTTVVLRFSSDNIYGRQYWVYLRALSANCGQSLKKKALWKSGGVSRELFYWLLYRRELFFSPSLCLFATFCHPHLDLMLASEIPWHCASFAKPKLIASISLFTSFWSNAYI